MAFGFGMGFRFGSRGGGGGDPTAITPANADAFLTALGLTQAGTGTTWGETGEDDTPLYSVAAGKVPLAVETIGGKQYFGPIVNPAGTNLALHDRDGTNAAWVKTNCTAELRTGSLSDAGAANGHTLITATGNNATFLQAITSTSGERVSNLWLARESGTGTVEITQDDGSTWAEVTLTNDPQPFNITAATLADPDVGIRIGTSGDSVRLYGVPHQVAARPLRPYIGPTAGSTVTSGGRSLRRTLGADITEVNISVVVPKNIGVIFRCHEVAGYQGSVYLYRSSDKYNLSNVRGSSLGGFAQGTGTIDVGAGDHDKIDVEYNDTLCRFRVNNGSWTSITRYGIPGSRVVGIGTDWQGNGAAFEPVLAFRDNIGNLLDGNRGWNHQLLDNWS